MSRAAGLSSAEKSRLYRQRLRASGEEQLLIELPRDIITMIDELKERQGLLSRSQALMQLIERGRESTQQVA